MKKTIRTVKDFFGGLGKPTLTRKKTTKRKPVKLDPKDHYGASNAAEIIKGRKAARQKMLKDMGS